MDEGSDPQPPDSGRPYEKAAVAGAALATLASPFKSLVAALLLQGSETDPDRKAQLRTWAWVSGGLVALGLIIGLIAVAAVASQVNDVRNKMRPDPSGPCQGGPQEGVPGVNIPGTNKYRIPCVFGGTATIRF